MILFGRITLAPLNLSPCFSSYDLWNLQPEENSNEKTKKKRKKGFVLEMSPLPID
jgi:hypothetical protein